MPLDDALKARMARPDFWALYLFEEEDDLDDEDEEEDLQARFDIGDGYGLVLNLDFFGYYGLDLLAPGLGEDMQIAWDDPAPGPAQRGNPPPMTLDEIGQRAVLDEVL